MNSGSISFLPGSISGDLMESNGFAPPHIMFPRGNIGWFLCVPPKVLFPYGNFTLPKNAVVV
jgi:hypothetical protein